MAAKNLFKKNKNNLTKIKNLVKKNLKIEPLDIDPTKIIKNTQSKIGSLYTNFKKEREKEKIKLEKRRKLEEKKDELRERKLAQKERLDKIREEKKQILIQKK